MEHHSLVWIQIPAEDLQRAANFYNRVFGYEFFFETLNDIPHALFKPDYKGRKPVNGALIEAKGRNSSEQGSVLFFDATGRFELIMEAIEQNGGKIIQKKMLIANREGANAGMIPKTYIDGKHGYYAHFLDSEGNKMGLYGSN